MNHYLLYGIGFVAQLLFSARMLVQWIYSERAGRVLSPVIFWQLSIFASFLLIVYGIFRRDPVIIGGQAVTYCIYIRNLHYQKVWQKIPRLFRICAWFFPFAALVWLSQGEHYNFANIINNEEIPLLLLAWGGAGQVIFTFRFIYQFIYMERVKESVLPLGFWIISLVGSFMVLSYAVFRKDPVLIMGQMFGFIVYGRNILIYLKKK